jgi:hypothetical protein
LAEIESGLGPFFDPTMLHYPIPSDLTREQFHSLVSSLCSQLKSSGLDPSQHLTYEDLDETVGDNVIGHRFAIFVSVEADHILRNPAKPN